MSKILVIPDVHLKPRMLDEAHEILEKGLADRAVVLGDLFDDWSEEANIVLYDRTADKVLWFHEQHPDTLWCMGNHDYGYYHPEWGKHESGHSHFAETTMRDWLKEFRKAGINQEIVHIVDNVLFCHGGINHEWLERQALIVGYSPADTTLDKADNIELITRIVNYAAPTELWDENSPLWWRPQKQYGGNPDEAWGKFLQVVGHSPVETPTQEGNILSCDTFSTYSNGAPFGDRSWVVVDTETKEREIVKGENE